MSITPPTGILDITDAIVRVSKLEFRGATGFDTILNNVARNTALLVDQNVEYTTDKAWGLKLPNAWVSEFDAYWDSGASGNIDFNIYNNTTSGTNGYVISMDDTTITVTYDGGSALETVSLGSTLKNDTWRKIHILFERDMISLALDGTPVLYFKDTLLRPRVYDEESGYVIASGLSADRKVKNLRILNGDKWMTDNTSNIAFVHGNVGIGTTQAAYTLDVKGDIRATGNLLIEGLTTTVDTQNLSIEDAIVEIGRGNDGGTSGKDVGFLFTRNNGADTTNSNVALIYDESTDRLTFGYSDGSPTDSTLAINTSKSLDVVIPSGNLGIGTASPSSLLDVRDISNNETKLQLITKTSTLGTRTQSTIELRDATNSHGGWIQGFHDAYVNHGLQLGSYSLGSRDAAAITIRSANVGIGTASPASALEIYGEGKDLAFKYDTGITRSSAANRDSYYSAKENSIKRVGDRNILDNSPFTPDTTHEILLGFSDTYSQWQTNDEYYPSYNEMRFKLWTPTNSTTGSLNDIMTLRSNGNVGIGTTSPEDRFHLYGSPLIQHSDSYSLASAGWYKIGTFTASGGGARLKIRILGSFQYGAGSSRGGQTEIYGSINNGVGSVCNMSGTYNYIGQPAVTSVKFVQTGSSELEYEVRAYFQSVTAHSFSVECNRGGVFVRSWTASSDPGANSSSVEAAILTHSISEGGSATFSGNVGIGTASPGAKLDVNGPEIRIKNADNAVARISAYGIDQGTGQLYVGQSIIHGGGIEYNGDGSPVSTGAGADYITLYRVQSETYSWTARNKYNTNQWEFRTSINNSDDRVKENETYIHGATETLMKIKPQLYDKKPSIESTDTKEWLCESGLIAQELYYDVPELRHLVKIPRDARDIDTNVSITSDDPTVDPDYSAWGKDTSAVNYIGLVPYLIKSVQEITTELPRHKTRVSNITPQNIEDFVGMIVSKRGSVELSTKSEDKACYGVISEIKCDTQNNEILVNSSGEGKIWVTNVNGNLEAGDFVTTSNIVGYGELQNSSVLSNFTVAKLTEDCDFNPPSTPVRRIRQRMSNVTVYSVTTEVRVTEEEYNELAEEDRTTENRITYFDGDNQIDFDTYSNLESNTLRTETTMVFKLIHRHTSRTMREGYTPEVRQELVNVLDEHGQLQWEDDPSGATEKAYKIRYLDTSGQITDEANAVHIAAFVGCTYHCG